mmetsp:Transcript_3084/g.4675  ORF Transcript_3084/g.4675 Transcript_3084/m.4675 type:complete len:244 (+) Transcript_3084:103-834(+)
MKQEPTGVRSTEECFALIEDLIIWKAFMSAFKKQNMLGSAHSEAFQDKMYKSYIKYLHRENRNNAYQQAKIKNPFQPRTREFINDRLIEEIVPEVMKFVSLIETISKHSDRLQEECYSDSLQTFKEMYGRAFAFNLRKYYVGRENKVEQPMKPSARSVASMSSASSAWNSLIQETHGSSFGFFLRKYYLENKVRQLTKPSLDDSVEGTKAQETPANAVKERPIRRLLCPLFKDDLIDGDLHYS